MYDFRFYQACKGQTQFINMGGGTMGFIGENIGSGKELSFFFLLHMFLKILLWGFNRYKEWINSIKLK